MAGRRAAALSRQRLLAILALVVLGGCASAPPTTAPPTSGPATTAQPTPATATQVPVTQGPISAPPATEATPPTQAPATQPPATQAPASEAPATQAPATEAPATEAPASEAPATVAPSEDPYRLLFTDDFSDPGSGFATGQFGDQEVTYTKNGLLLRLTAPDRSTLTTRDLAADWPGVRVEATMQPRARSGQFGYHGLVCGPDEANAYVGLVSSDGAEWIVVRLVDGQANVLDRGTVPAGLISPVDPTHLTLECSATAPGADPGVALRAGSETLATLPDQAGFPSFRRVGFEAESSPTSDGYAALATRVAAWVSTRATGVGSPGPTLDPDLERLLTHVPVAVRSTCMPASEADPHILAAVSCTPGGGISDASYTLYDATAAMDATYAATAAPHQSEMTFTDCADGPAQGDYQVDGATVGRIACYRESGAATIVWTDTRLSILAHGVRDDGDFNAIDAWWLGAGPLP